LGEDAFCHGIDGGYWPVGVRPIASADNREKAKQPSRPVPHRQFDLPDHERLHLATQRQCAGEPDPGFIRGSQIRSGPQTCSDRRQFRRLLRASGERPCHCAADEGNERATSPAMA
jgi:hypothetical protein